MPASRSTAGFNRRCSPLGQKRARNTAHSTLTRCCTGAHFEPKTGTEKVEPTTAMAANTAARASFFVFTLVVATLAAAEFSLRIMNLLLQSKHRRRKVHLTALRGRVLNCLRSVRLQPDLHRGRSAASRANGSDRCRIIALDPEAVVHRTAALSEIQHRIQCAGDIVLRVLYGCFEIISLGQIRRDR